MAVGHWAALVAQMVKNLPEMRETWDRFLSREDLLEKRMVPEWSSGFPYFLQFNSGFGNKEFMI